MGIEEIFTRRGLFPSTDRQITSGSTNQSRSESAVAANPTNAGNLIAISKKFIDPKKYHFTCEPMVTHDGGYTWLASPLPKPVDWDGMTDPVVAFGPTGKAFVVVEPLRFDPEDIVVTGIQAFTSTNGGNSWSAPSSLIVGRSVDGNDDKPWMAVDRGSSSAWAGRVYVVWGVGGALRLARSKDAGVHWVGVGALSAGANVSNVSGGVYAPEVSVDEAGTVHVFWHLPGSATINYTRSLDGGESFEAPRVVVNGVVGLTASTLPKTGDWPEFPGGKFRVLTLVSACCVGNRIIVVWADMREGHSRIYHHYSDDSGANWNASSGQPLWPSLSSASTVQQFHPQIVADAEGIVGCAFYEFGSSAMGLRIRTRMLGSFDAGSSFGVPVDISDQPWNPAINAPLSHGNPNDTFIGEYFGLDAFESGFAVVATDTRTGVQELFFDHVVTRKFDPPGWWDGIVATLVGPGVALGAGGWVIVGGKLIKVPPRGPKYALLQAIATLDAAEAIQHPTGRKIVEETIEAMASIVKEIGKNMRSRGE